MRSIGKWKEKLRFGVCKAIVLFWLPQSLWAICLKDLLLPTKVVRLGGAANSLEFSLDSSRVLVGMEGGRWVEVDAQDGSVLRHDFENKGNTFAGYRSDEPVSVGGSRRVVLNGHGVYCCQAAPISFASTSDYLAIVTQKKVVELVDANSFRLIRKLSLPESWLSKKAQVTTVAFSPKGDKVAVAYFEKNVVQILAYETKTGGVIYTGEIAHSNLAPDLTDQWSPTRDAPLVMKLAFSDNGDTLVAAYRSYLNAKSSSWIGQVFFIPVQQPEKMTSLITINDDSREQYARHNVDLDLSNDNRSLIIAQTGAEGPPYSRVGKPWVIAGKLPRAVIYQKRGDTFFPALELVGHDEAVSFVRMGAEGRVATIGNDNLLVLWETKKALSSGQGVGIFNGGRMGLGITSTDHRGFGYPPNFLFGTPPAYIWDPQGRRIQGTIVDESLGPFL